MYRQYLLLLNNDQYAYYLYLGNCRLKFEILSVSYLLKFDWQKKCVLDRSLLEICLPFKTTIRTKIRYSKLNKDKTVRPVVRRFYRLDWGAWIRTRCGRGKKRFQKSAERKRRLDQHVFCNKQQNKLLDQLVTPYWRRKMFFVDDPYAPYQKRHHIPRYYKEKPVFLPWF